MKKQNWFVYVLAMVALAFFSLGCSTKPQTLYQRIIEVPGEKVVDADKVQTVYQTFVPNPTSVAAKEAAAPTMAVVKNAAAPVARTAATPAGVAIRDGVEVMPTRNDPTKMKNCIAMQTVWDPKGIWRRQVIPFNGATQDMVTDEMKRLAENNIPNRNGLFDWESWKFTILYPKGFTTAAISETKNIVSAAPAPVVEKTTKTESVVAPPVAAKPAPAAPDNTADLEAKLKALKAKLAVTEAAEKKRLAEAAKKTACLEGLKKLGYEGIEGIKKFQSKYALVADGIAGPETCKQVKAVLATCQDCGRPAPTPSANTTN